MSSGSYWSEVKVEIPSELGELVAEIFQEEGAGGVVYDDPAILEKLVLKNDEYLGKELAGVIPERFGLRAYFPVDDRLGERMLRLKERVGEILGHPPVFELKQVQEEDWAEAWKTYFKPEHIGKIVIKPSWEEYAPADSEIIIELDPGMAFGTGTHPTTRLCVTLLQEVVDSETEILDIGTGSGILALVGAKLGAKGVIAIDIDPLAVRTARENIERNNLQDAVSVIESDLLERQINSKFNLVVANIITNAILELIPQLKGVLAMGGQFLASGIIEERYFEIEKALIQYDFTIVKVVTNEGWVGVLARRG